MPAHHLAKRPASDTRRSAAFVAVAEELNYTRAAERLHLAPPGPERHGQQLEAALGVKLLDRTTRSPLVAGIGEVARDEASSVVAFGAPAGIEPSTQVRVRNGMPQTRERR